MSDRETDALRAEVEQLKSDLRVSKAGEAFGAVAVAERNHAWAKITRLEVRVDQHRERLARARRWIETCVDPLAVGPERKQAMLDYLDGKRDAPDFDSIPRTTKGIDQ